MAAPARVHTLELIGKLRSQAVEEVAVRLGRLWAEIARIDKALAALVEARQARPGSHSLEAAPYVGRFLQATREEEARLEAERAALEQELRRTEAELRSRFREAKINDTLLARAEQARREAQERAEAAALDETALRGFLPRIG